MNEEKMNGQEMELDQEAIVELVDDEGNEVAFEHLMTLEHNGAYYIVLMAAEDLANEEDDEGEVLILKMDKDENGEDCYVTIDDDDEAQTVFDKFVAALEEEDDAVPADEE